MDSTYAEVGTWVILGKHNRRVDFYGWDFGFEWQPEMEQYVGRKTQIRITDGRLCLVWCDGGAYRWRVENMILASDVPLLTPEQKQQLNIEE